MAECLVQLDVPLSIALVGAEARVVLTQGQTDILALAGKSILSSVSNEYCIS